MPSHWGLGFPQVFCEYLFCVKQVVSIGNGAVNKPHNLQRVTDSNHLNVNIVPELLGERLLSTKSTEESSSPGIAPAHRHKHTCALHARACSAMNPHTDPCLHICRCTHTGGRRVGIPKGTIFPSCCHFLLCGDLTVLEPEETEESMWLMPPLISGVCREGSWPTKCCPACWWQSRGGGRQLGFPTLFPLLLGKAGTFWWPTYLGHSCWGS